MSKANGHGARNGKPTRLGDLDSARLAVKVARTGEPVPSDLFDRLEHEWGEACLAAADDPAGGLAFWIKGLRNRFSGDPARLEAMAEALEAAKVEKPEPPPRTFLSGALKSSEFSRREFPRRWLIKGVLVEKEPAIVAGPKKSLKTTLMADMGVSLAAAVPFLGEFEVPKPTRVLFLSGESGEATLQETAHRVCHAKGLRLEDLDDRLHWNFELPRLNELADLELLAAYIRENGIEVVIIDPLYLCLISGGMAVDPANLFSVGPLLKRISAACIEAGATPILVHHLRKNREDAYAPPELEDMAFAGVQEFARQWIMLGRRERYEPGSGEHKLWLAVGGSAGHSGAWALDVHEGIVDDEFGGRDWRVEVIKANEAREAAKALQEAAKASRRDRDDERKAAETEKDATQVHKALLKATGPLTKEDLKGAAGLRGDRLNIAIWKVTEEWKLAESCQFEKRCGAGDRTVSGYRIVAPGTHPATPGTHPDMPGVQTPRHGHPALGGSPPVGGSPQAVPGVRVSGSQRQGEAEETHKPPGVGKARRRPPR